jgi:glucosamine--fructose-6-phosphate aminotransferase (isomerizing)
MTLELEKPGRWMASEAGDAINAFVTASSQDVAFGSLGAAKAIYSIARGSSDAAANILSYEVMRTLRVPCTSLPPSVFSLGGYVDLKDAAVLVISQSGASDDLVRSAEGAIEAGANVLAITNQPDSPVERAANLTMSIGAGPEKAVPATKTVTGAIGAGAALLSALSPQYRGKAQTDANVLASVSVQCDVASAIKSGLLRGRHVYVVGRDTGYGAAIEVALKLKECCAIPAEAYSSSEVLHGPLQLATNPLMVLMLDTGADEIQDSLDQAQARFVGENCDVFRLRPSSFGIDLQTPAAAAALMLAAMYPIILDTALALGFNPDTPQTLSKVTKTT